MTRLAIVLPCYNEVEALPLSIPVLKEIMHEMIDRRLISADSYIFCVDDGSRDSTWDMICSMHEADLMVKGLTLAHNAGQQYALLSGLMAVREKCDAAVTIDADLQDDPRAIIKMVEKFREGYEIVYGVRDKRDTDTWFKRNSARAFYKFQNSMGLETIYDHSDYRLMSSRALGFLSGYKESNLFLRGIVPKIGLKNTIVKYDRSARCAGESKYPLSKMLSFSIDGITSFSAKPMRMIFTLGMIMLVFDLLMALYVSISYFSGHTATGWSSLMFSIWFVGSLILISIGIVGEYIGKIFVEVKNRPRYNIDRELW